MQVRDASGIALDLQKEKEALKKENFELKETLVIANSCLETLQNVKVRIMFKKWTRHLELILMLVWSGRIGL